VHISDVTAKSLEGLLRNLYLSQHALQFSKVSKQDTVHWELCPCSLIFVVVFLLVLNLDCMFYFKKSGLIKAF